MKKNQESPPSLRVGWFKAEYCDIVDFAYLALSGS